MERLQNLKRMLLERRVGFMVDEEMSGTHHFVNQAGPEGELPMSFRVNWGNRHMRKYLNPLRKTFLTNFVEGEVSVAGLVENAPCRGTLELRYFTEGKIRYQFEFKDVDRVAYLYVGEKVGIRPWNLPHSHTTCYGTITNLATGAEVSKSILHFELDTLPSFIQSFRLA